MREKKKKLKKERKEGEKVSILFFPPLCRREFSTTQKAKQKLNEKVDHAERN